MLARAVASAPATDQIARQAIYRSARRAMVKAFLRARPNSLGSVLSAEHNEFNSAVARVEDEILHSGGPSLFESKRPEGLVRRVGARARFEAEAEIDTHDLQQIPDVDRSRSVQERPMSRLDELNKILRKLQSDSRVLKPAR